MSWFIGPFIAAFVASAITDWLWRRRLRRTEAGKLALRQIKRGRV